MSPRRGYLTMAVGRPRFLEMAVDMALSLRAHTEHPIGLAADPGLARVARERYPAVFDDVELIPNRFLDGRCRKFGLAEASPYDETMYVDADCIVLGSLDGLWSALHASDVAMVGSHLTAEQNENHHGFSTRRLIRRFGLERYLKTNSGLFCFRTEPAVEILEACRVCFEQEARPRLRWQILLGRWLGDEIAFGIVGGRRNLGTFPLPSPMYWPQEFPTLDLEEPTKPLLHLIWPPEPELVDALVRGTTARRRAARVPGDAERHWREEVHALERMARRRRLAERLGIWG